MTEALDLRPGDRVAVAGMTRPATVVEVRRSTVKVRLHTGAPMWADAAEVRRIHDPAFQKFIDDHDTGEEAP